MHVIGNDQPQNLKQNEIQFFEQDGHAYQKAIKLARYILNNCNSIHWHPKITLTCSASHKYLKSMWLKHTDFIKRNAQVNRITTTNVIKI